MVKERVDKVELKIKYCPTQILLKYDFTKLLKGKAFKILRYVIMGYRQISPLELIPVSIQDHVGNKVGNS